MRSSPVRLIWLSGLILLAVVASWSPIASATVYTGELSTNTASFPQFSGGPRSLRLFSTSSHTDHQGLSFNSSSSQRTFNLDIGDVFQVGEIVVVEILPPVGTEGIVYGRTDRFDDPIRLDYDLGMQDSFFCLGELGSSVLECEAYFELLRGEGADPPLAAVGEFVLIDFDIELVSTGVTVGPFLFDRDSFSYRPRGVIDFTKTLGPRRLEITSPDFGLAMGGAVVEFEFKGTGDVRAANHIHLRIDDGPVVEVPFLAQSRYRFLAHATVDTGEIGTHLVDAWMVDASHNPLSGGGAQSILFTTPNTAPNGMEDYYATEQSQLLRVVEEYGVLANDSDDDGHSLSALLLDPPANGRVTLRPDGAFDYIPDPLFFGEDTFTYLARDLSGGSSAATVRVIVSPHDRPKIGIELATLQGQPITPGGSVSGLVIVTVTVHDALGYHAQFYSNFEVLPTREPAHGVTGDPWIRTAVLDTRSFFDGENLISVHVHPQNEYGEVYNTTFEVGQFVVDAGNGKIAPRGDVKLPELSFVDGQFEPFSSTFGDLGWRLSGTAQLMDDGGSLDIGSRSTPAGNAQVIPHLGSTVLGRGRWPTRIPPFGDGTAVSGVKLAPFQGDEEYEARIVFFFSDAVGRANYAFKDFTMPPISPEQAEAFPLPGLDAEVLGLSQGDSIVLSDDASVTIDVLVTDPLPAADEFPFLTLWLGNRAVATTDLRPQLAQLQPGQRSFLVQLEIPKSEVELLQVARNGGQGSTAFALWLDFANITTSRSSVHYPTSSHLHLTSVRTEDHLDEIYLQGGHRDEILRGSPGPDVIGGGAGTDNLFGAGGNDWLVGGAGNDTIEGGEGWDTAVFYGSGDYSIQQFGLLTRVDYGADMDWLTEVEALQFRDGIGQDTWELVEGAWLLVPEPGRQSLALAALAALSLLRNRSRRQAKSRGSIDR